MNCKNCSTVLASESDFCHKCGAKIIRKRLTLKNLFDHFVETFFSYDNKFLKTIVNLFKNPKDVIGSYVDGVRNKYMAPLAFFVVALTISGVYLFVIRKYFPNFFEIASSLHDDELAKENQRKIMESVMEYNSILNFAYIPIAALLSRLVFLRNGYNFTEHLVIYFYLLPLFSIFSSVITMFVLMFSPNASIAVTFALSVLFFFYCCYALKQIFSLSFKQMLIKALLFILLFFITYIILSISLAIIAIATGLINLQDFAPPS